jgi:hypothetical protein
MEIFVMAQAQPISLTRHPFADGSFKRMLIDGKWVDPASGKHFESRNPADVFLAYCSAAAPFKKDLPDGSVVNLPPELATEADYGLTLLPPKSENATALAVFILSQDGQKILARNGFDAPLLLAEQH